MIVYFIFDIFIILEEKQQLSVIGICFIFCIRNRLLLNILQVISQKYGLNL